MPKRKNANDQMMAWIEGIRKMELNLVAPNEQTINWNPLEYKVVRLDLLKGEILLEKIIYEG